MAISCNLIYYSDEEKYKTIMRAIRLYGFCDWVAYGTGTDGLREQWGYLPGDARYPESIPEEIVFACMVAATY
ncbi:MAG: hypothetical protein ACLRS8_18300 [Parabacteroides merdae]